MIRFIDSVLAQFTNTQSVVGADIAQQICDGKDCDYVTSTIANTIDDCDLAIMSMLADADTFEARESAFDSTDHDDVDILIATSSPNVTFAN